MSRKSEPRMKELIAHGLFGRGLIEINSAELVRRYVAAMKHLGLVPTKLKSFQIDQVGWSPQIAAEQGDNYYLGHGEANGFAIILTPEQYDAPIYFTRHSFKWRLMKQWFKTHRTQVVELTKSTAICLDIDQDVDLYEVPSDLLMVNEVTVRASTPDGLMKAAATQQDLVRNWMNSPDAHLNEDLILDLEASAREYGDLRQRTLNVHDFFFSDVRDFYSRRFDGMFVLRSLNRSPLIFARDESFVDGEVVLPADHSAIDLLLKHGYVETDVQWWQNHLYRLKVIAESFLVDVIEENDARINFAKLNEPHKKSLVEKHQDKLGEYLELMRIYKALKRGKIRKMSPEMAMYLLHPTDVLSNTSRELVWQLLTYIQGGRFVPLMYRHQKSDFMDGYTTSWKLPRRSWALARVQQFYDVASKSSGLEL